MGISIYILFTLFRDNKKYKDITEHGAIIVRQIF